MEKVTSALLLEKINSCVLEADTIIWKTIFSGKFLIYIVENSNFYLFNKISHNWETIRINMKTTCEVQFENNPSRVFYSGQLMRGTVYLTNEENIRRVYLTITGDAFARWSEGRNEGARPFFGKETYLNTRIDLFTANDGKQYVSTNSI